MKSLKNSKQAMTLIEVMLSIGIIAILAVLSVTSLYYPTQLVVNSGREQSAIHAGIGELERNLKNPGLWHLGSQGELNNDGWEPSISNAPVEIVTNDVPGTADQSEYTIIRTTVNYGNGDDEKNIELLTYRSRLPEGSQR
ncbi:MAG: type II secretion system protein [Kiritimatiellales bacterium]|nr:type II secretion system protein [Kiritimatiellota bacterium]MBL7015932.1 type II secretion system protein [Kiritimatiellales bacterium]